MANPKSDIRSKIAEMVDWGTEAHLEPGAVEQKISECRQLLEQPDRLGLWEAAELEYADRALQSGFLRLALFCASKAIDVSELPNEEYEAGYSYTQTGPTKGFTP